MSININLFQLTTSLVQGGDESRVVVEGGEHKSVVLPVDLQDGAHVDLRIIESVVAQLLNGRQALGGDVVLQQVPQLAQTVRDTGDELRGNVKYRSMMGH